MYMRFPAGSCSQGPSLIVCLLCSAPGMFTFVASVCSQSKHFSREWHCILSQWVCFSFLKASCHILRCVLMLYFIEIFDLPTFCYLLNTPSVSTRAETSCQETSWHFRKSPFPDKHNGPSFSSNKTTSCLSNKLHFINQLHVEINVLIAISIDYLF